MAPRFVYTKVHEDVGRTNMFAIGVRHAIVRYYFNIIKTDSIRV